MAAPRSRMGAPPRRRSGSHRRQGIDMASRKLVGQAAQPRRRRRADGNADPPAIPTMGPPCFWTLPVFAPEVPPPSSSFSEAGERTLRLAWP